MKDGLESDPKILVYPVDSVDRRYIRISTKLNNFSINYKNNKRELFDRSVIDIINKSFISS
jgi:hypothetical protein